MMMRMVPRRFTVNLAGHLQDVPRATTCFASLIAYPFVVFNSQKHGSDVVSADNSQRWVTIIDTETDNQVRRRDGDGRARLSAYTASLKSGPLAVIGLSDEPRLAFRRFVNISPAKRPARLFETEVEARTWLKEVATRSTTSALRRSTRRETDLQRSTRSSATGLRSAMLKRPA
jgi:hypothetical protein